MKTTEKTIEIFKEKKGVKKEADYPNTIITDTISLCEIEASTPLLKDLDFGRTSALYNEKLLKKRSRNMFITIPRTNMTKEDLMENIKKVSKNVEYICIGEEQHMDGTPHIHLVFKSSEAVYIKNIHNKIMMTKGLIGGSINYSNTRNNIKAINYAKKDGNFVEYGSNTKPDKEIKISFKEILKDILTNNKSKIDNLEYIKINYPQYYIEKYTQINNVLDEKERPKERIFKTWDIEPLNPNNINLSIGQQKVWQLINLPPKNRRIIWITGQPGCGKSFLMNYIQQNYEYGMYNAGACSSMDNVIYGYNGQGSISWDLPMNFDFEKLGNKLASTIEKFSDLGQILTSKKYTGKTVISKGHVLVFSNRGPLKQLEHRDIISIQLDNTKLLNNKFNIKSPYFEYDSDIDTESTSSQLTYDGPDIGYN